MSAMSPPSETSRERSRQLDTETGKEVTCVNADDVRYAEAVIDRWQICGMPATDWLAHRIGGISGRVGANRQLSVRTLCVGRLLLAQSAQVSDAPQFLDRLHHLLLSLHPRTRERLGVSEFRGGEEVRTVTLKQVRYLWHRLVEVLDPSPHFGAADLPTDERTARAQLLQSALDGLLAATLPTDLAHEGSLSIDSTYLDAWARPHWRSPKREAIEKLIESEPESESPPADDVVIGLPPDETDLRAIARAKADELTPAQRALLTEDPDARHRWMQNRSSKTGRWLPPKKDVWGYQITLAAWVREDGGGPAPCLALRVLVRPANSDEAQSAVELLEGFVRDGGVLSDVVADRGFTYRLAENFAAPVRRLGGRIVMDLHPNQRGPRGATTGGAIWIDGWPHCPATPEELWHLEQPQPGDSWKVISDKIAAYERRKAYALALLEYDDGRGGQRFQCPASSCRLICELKGESIRLDPARKPTVWNPPEGVGSDLPRICQQRTVTIPVAEQEWIRQHHYFGGRLWYESYHKRRNVVEGFFGHMKNEGGEHLKRGVIRAHGIAEHSLLVGFLAAAANMRLLRTFKADYSPDPAALGWFEVGDVPDTAIYRSGRQTRRIKSPQELLQWGAQIRQKTS